jgi:hypothetical protein
MNRADIKTLAESLTTITTDSDTLGQFITDVFDENGFRSNPQMVKASLESVVSGTATYSFDSDVYKLIRVFFGSEMLSFTSANGLDAYSTTWGADSGLPKAITQDELTVRTYTLYPNPNVNSDPVIPVHGEPYGEDYPANNLTLIYSENRQDNIMDIYALPIAVEALSREFAYPSNHTDLEYSDTCKKLAELFNQLIGFK